MNPLPEGTAITVDYEGGLQKIIVPHKSGGVFRIFIALFMIFWLGGWATGWVTAATSIVKSESPAGAFIIFWLCGWTVGGVFAFYFLYRLLRPSKPEIITLGSPSLTHDTGFPPFHFSFDFKSQAEIWKRLFFKRKQAEFSTDELKTLSLREHDGGNRLTIDKGNTRVELACSATEIEREWLHNTLKSKYPYLT